MSESRYPAPSKIVMEIDKRCEALDEAILCAQTGGFGDTPAVLALDAGACALHELRQWITGDPGEKVKQPEGSTT